ncbi:hypothetical protein BDV93DRAFT_565339 [Ceratobasidium sp. AG-I]|nr:hypothetical protein BDV93DRAFT_565339 [Ceratobasidium sp. AG-I]
MSEPQAAAEVNLEIEADFTGADNSRAVVSCQQPVHNAECKNPNGPDFPPGGRLYPVTNRKGKSEVLLCYPCFLYMQSKTGTITRQRPAVSNIPNPGTSAASSGQVVYSVNHQAIRTGTNAAQRGDLIRPPFVATSQGSQSSGSNIIPPAQFATAPLDPSQYQGPSASDPMLAAHHAPKVTGTGYSLSPSGFLGSRSSRNKSRVLTPSPIVAHVPVETFTLTYWVKYPYGSGTTCRVAFGIPGYGIDNVNAHSTGTDLRGLVPRHLAEKWSAATHGFPLTNNIWTLQDKNLVDLHAFYPFTPAFLHLCTGQVGSTGKTCFLPGKKMSAFVMLSAEAYAAIQTHIEEISLQVDYSDVSLSVSANRSLSLHHGSSLTTSTSPVPTTPVTPKRTVGGSVAAWEPTNTPMQPSDRPWTTSLSVKKRAHVTSPNSTTRSPPSKRLNSYPGASMSHLIGAMQDGGLQKALQLHGGINSTPAIVDGSRTVVVQFFPLSDLSLAELITNTVPINLNSSTSALHGTLLYNSKSPNSTLGIGTFKRCILGKLVLQPTPTFGLGSEGNLFVALKRPFEKNGKGGRTRLPPGDEVNFLVKEAVLWQWGLALLSLVYCYLSEHKLSGHEDRPPIPCARFVHAAIAKSVSQDDKGVNELSGGFLVEERIDPELGFCRFVGNSSAAPISFPKGSESYNLGQFYSFCQHVQWGFTNGSAYCADWQGSSIADGQGDFLLTDPQIMTHPNLGNMLFADGNVPAAFQLFVSQHDCTSNIFCQFFKPAPLCETA